MIYPTSNYQVKTVITDENSKQRIIFLCLFDYFIHEYYRLPYKSIFIGETVTAYLFLITRCKSGVATNNLNQIHNYLYL